MREEDSVLLPRTTLESSKTCYIVYTRENKAKVTIKAVEKLIQM